MAVAASMIPVKAYASFNSGELYKDKWPFYDAMYYDGYVYALQGHPDGMKMIQYRLELDGSQAHPVETRAVMVNNIEIRQDCAEADVHFATTSHGVYIVGNGVNDKGVYVELFYKVSIQPDGKYSISEAASPDCDLWDQGKLVTYRNHSLFFGITSTKDFHVKLGIEYTDGAPEDPSAVWNSVDLGVLSPRNEEIYRIAVTPVYTEKNGTVVEQLVVVALFRSSSDIWAGIFDKDISQIGNLSAWKVNYQKDIFPSQGYYMKNVKILQGKTMTETGDWNESGPINSLQLFFSDFSASTSYAQRPAVGFYEFDAASLNFKKEGAHYPYVMGSGMDYGYTGVTLASYPIEAPYATADPQLGATTSQDFRRCFVIFRGAGNTGHFTNCSSWGIVKSNKMKVTWGNVDFVDVLNDPETRKVCTLTGVIEGAPPIVVDNGAMYDNICSRNGDYLSSITMGESGTDGITSQSTQSYDVTAGLGPDLGAWIMQFLGGYEAKEMKGSDQSFSWSHHTSIYNQSPSTAATGYLLYTVPKLDRYTSDLYTPDGKIRIDEYPQTVTFHNTGSTDMLVPYRLDGDDLSEEIRVMDPMKLEEWARRGDRLFFYTPADKVVYERNLLVTSMNVDKLTRTCGSSSDFTDMVTIGGNIKTPAFQTKAQGHVGFRNTSSTSVGSDISIEIKSIRSEFLSQCERENAVTSYDLRCYMLDDPAEETYGKYASAFRNAGYMNDKETPFFMTWRVSNLSGPVNISESGVDTVGRDDTIAPWAMDGCEIVMVRPATVYSVAGYRMGNYVCGDRLSLPSGLYIVVTPQKSYRLMVK